MPCMETQAVGIDLYGPEAVLLSVYGMYRASGRILAGFVSPPQISTIKGVYLLAGGNIGDPGNEETK